jgi:hypothetical protein
VVGRKKHNVELDLKPTLPSGEFSQPLSHYLWSETDIVTICSYVFFLLTSHEKWLSGYTHHTCGRRPDSNPRGVVFCTPYECPTSYGILAILTTLVAGLLVA